jgi:HD-GYP domain-containing protein (c-di-GMP phosphodiesterase class II)
MKKKVPVSDLQLGMFVYELDRPWTETPFAFQRFVVKDDEQLQTLRRFCKHVYVDTEPELQDASREKLPPGPGPLAPGLQGTGKVVHAARASVEGEMPRAGEAHGAAQTVMREAIARLRSSKDLDAGDVTLAIINMTDSMLRNPDAMVLLNALQKSGDYQLGRAVNKSIYMIAFARFLGMEESAIELAGQVGMLEDVGMLRVPEELRARSGRLTPQELALVRQHVASSVEMLRGSSDLPPAVAQIAEMHHERYDGTGYPRGLKGDEIGVLGAIAGIVDVFDALTSKRPYADAMSPSNALNFLQKMRGTAFHPVLVEQFTRCIGFFPVGSAVELNSGEIGIVISQNLAKRLQPRVMVVRDGRGALLRPQKLLDLAKLPKLTAEEPYRIRRTLEYGRAEVSVRDVMMA